MENGYRFFTKLHTSLYLYFQREISAVVKRHLPFHQAFRGRILMDAKRVLAQQALEFVFCFAPCVAQNRVSI